MEELRALVRAVMAIDPAAPALEYHGNWTTWGEMTAIMVSVDTILADRGIGPGARIGGILANTPQVAAVIVGTLTSARCMVTLNPLLPDEKLAADILGLRMPAVIARQDDWDRPAVREALASAGSLGIALTGNSADPVRVIQEQAKREFHVDAHGVGIEMLTSGTTGTPKRIPLKATNFERMTLDAAVFESREAGAAPRLSRAVSIINTPFSHIGGIFTLFMTLTAGRKGCLLDRFRVDEFVDALRRHRPKAIGIPPSALRMLLDADVDKEALSSLMVVRTSTAPLDPALADAFEDRFGIPVLQNYGATEFAGGVAGWTFEDHRKHGKDRRGSVGRINPGVEGRVVDQETGAPLPYGETGLLELRAPSLGDGVNWLRTTDLAKMDADRFLWIVGRADNAIIRGGFKVFPDDVVKAIEAHPAVLEAAVVAMPDERLGQVPAAAYRLRSGQSLDVDELRTWLRRRLSAYQMPVGLLQVDDLPRTPSMKPSQPELRGLFERQRTG